MDLGIFIGKIWPLVVTTFVVVGIYYAVKFLLNRQSKGKTDTSLIRSLILFSIAAIGFIAILLSLPLGDTLKGQVSSLLGIVISAIFALSSATFIGNALAGIMLRSINNYKPGDFISVNQIFGRVTERGLFHTEIQNETRDLITLPNMFLATNPVQVTRSSGTYISATCSLGYDVNRQIIEKALLKAADEAGLSEPFVNIIELGDFSVVYRLHGLLTEVKTIISSKSRLHAMMLDCLHAEGIEIVSPNFMNQRQVGDTIFVPKKLRKKEEIETQDTAPEAVIFDKAEEAESIESRKGRLAELNEKIKSKQVVVKQEKTEAGKVVAEEKLNKMIGLRDRLVEKIESKQDELNKE